ncbi:MAG: hypothetical protein PXY39_11005 [archaeon]|nr:hypothetical protein [archaeon]
MVSIAALAILGAMSGIGATSVANGDASSAVQAASQLAPHGLSIALQHVPSWTHAHEVLSQHLSQYAENSGAGSGIFGGLGVAFKKGFAHIGKALIRPR